MINCHRGENQFRKTRKQFREDVNYRKLNTGETLILSFSRAEKLISMNCLSARDTEIRFVKRSLFMTELRQVGKTLCGFKCIS